MTIKAVVFDFGGVLLGYQGINAWANGINKQYGVPGKELLHSILSTEFSEWLGEGRNLFCGSITAEEVEGDYMAEFIKQKFNVDLNGEHPKPLQALLGPNIKHHMNETMCSVVPQLKGFGFKSALLTNNCYLDKEKKFDRIPIDKNLYNAFDDVIESCIEGVAKPDPKIYEITQKRLGLKPEEIIFLDDLLENCEAAQKLGWNTIQVKDELTAVKELEEKLGVTFKKPSANGN